MKKHWLFVLLLLLGTGSLWATEPDDEAPTEETNNVVERRVEEITMQEAVFRKIRAESVKSPDKDTSQLSQEADENDTDVIEGVEPIDYDAAVNKIFDSLY
jgi:hypothetical protein